MLINEAKNKFCCRMKLNNNHNSLLLCEANECMAWRWNKVGIGDIISQDKYDNIIYEKYINSTIDGYCGLCEKDMDN